MQPLKRNYDNKANMDLKQKLKTVLIIKQFCLN